jgi:cytochrome c oxidase assembly factor CtaG
VSIAGWSVDLPLAYVALMASLWLLGGRGGPPTRRWRAAAFWAGLAALVLALDSPIDQLADRLLWVHMIQHLLLLTVAPPLLLAARPGPRLLRALPVGARRTLAHGLARSRWAAPLRTLARPLPAWLAFSGTLAVWHLPGLYDATLRSAAVHDLEHITFYATGLLFWAHALAVPPLRAMLDWPRRAGYVAGAMVVGWALALVLALARHPLYSVYAHLAHRPGGISAIADQQLAAGMMWVPGSITLTIAFILALYRWLEPQRERSAAPAVTI